MENNFDPRKEAWIIESPIDLEMKHLMLSVLESIGFRVPIVLKGPDKGYPYLSNEPKIKSMDFMGITAWSDGDSAAVLVSGKYHYKYVSVKELMGAVERIRREEYGEV